MTPHTQRLKLSTTAITAQPLTLSFWRGVPLRVQVAVFDHLDTADMDEVDALVIMVKRDRSDLDSAALMSLTQPTLSSCTANQWIAKTHQHASFEFTAAECNLDLQGSIKGVFHVVFKAVLSDGSELILGIGQAVCYEANAGAVGDPPTNPEPALTQAVADLRYIQATLSGDRITFPDGKFIYLNTED